MLSFIIPTYKNKHIFNTIESIIHNTNTPYEIILIFNPKISTHLKNIGEKYKETILIEIYTKDETNIPLSRNLGILNARGEWIVWIDDDCILSNTYINNLLKITENTNKNILRGTVIFEKTNNWFSKTYAEMRTVWYSNTTKTLTPNLIVRRSVYSKIGLFDTLAIGGEDTEWGDRAQNSGYTCEMHEGIIIHHAIETYKGKLKTWMDYGKCKGYRIVKHLVNKEKTKATILIKNLLVPSSIKFTADIKYSLLVIIYHWLHLIGSLYGILINTNRIKNLKQRDIFLKSEDFIDNIRDSIVGIQNNKWKYNTNLLNPPQYVKTQLYNMEYRIRSKLKAPLDMVEITNVDNYHKHTYFLYNKNNNKEFVIKLLTNNSWDNSIVMVKRDIAIANFVQNILPEIIVRQVEFEIYEKDIQEGMICYKKLGKALTNITNKEKIIDIVHKTYALLYKLHINTIQGTWGYGQFESIPGKPPEDIFYLSFKFLLNDLQRDNIPHKDEISDILQEKWKNLITKDKQYCLTHRDITLSNIIEINSNQITFIDWTYSVWQSPNYDLANIFFWDWMYGNKQYAFKKLVSVLNTYTKYGFNLEITIGAFIARKLIDYGRFKNLELIEMAYEILKAEGLSEVETILNKTS